MKADCCRLCWCCEDTWYFLYSWCPHSVIDVVRRWYLSLQSFDCGMFSALSILSRNFDIVISVIAEVINFILVCGRWSCSLSFLGSNFTSLSIILDESRTPLSFFVYSNYHIYMSSVDKI